MCWLWLCIAFLGLFLVAGKACSPGCGAGTGQGCSGAVERVCSQLGLSWWQGAFRMLLVLPAGL